MSGPVWCPESIAVSQDFCLHGDHILLGIKARDKQMSKYIVYQVVVSSVLGNLSMLMMRGMRGFRGTIGWIVNSFRLRGHLSRDVNSLPVCTML